MDEHTDEGSPAAANRASEHSQTGELADPGAKTQPAEGGREEADDGGMNDDDGAQEGGTDDAGN